MLGIEKEEVCPGRQSWSREAGDSKTEPDCMQPHGLSHKSEFGFTKPVGSKNVLRQGSALTVSGIEGDSFRVYLCM